MESIALLLALFHYLRFLSLRLICCIFISPGFTLSRPLLSLVNILHVVVYFVRSTHTRLPFSCHSLLLSDSRLVGRVYISLYSIHHNFGCAYAYFFSYFTFLVYSVLSGCCCAAMIWEDDVVYRVYTPQMSRREMKSQQEAELRSRGKEGIFSSSFPCHHCCCYSYVLRHIVSICSLVQKQFSCCSVSHCSRAIFLLFNKLFVKWIWCVWLDLSGGDRF